MTKTVIPAALFLLVLWGAATRAQQETPATDPDDLFTAPSVDTPQEDEPKAPQQELAEVDIAQDTALHETPVFNVGKWSEHSDRIDVALNGPLTEVGLNFTDVPMLEAVNFLREVYQIEVQLDLQALDDLGLSPDDTFTANIRHVSLSSGLKMLLKQHDLTYIIADEVLLITSEDEALARLSVRVYPVGDLLQPKEGHGPATATVDNMIDALISTIASDTWAENGGGEAEIRPLQPGMLIISQTQAVHEEIAHLLAALRRARQHELAMPYKQELKPGGGWGRTSGAPRGGRGGFGGGGGYGGEGGRGGESPDTKTEKDQTPDKDE
jgi:hypothetical protein